MSPRAWLRRRFPRLSRFFSWLWLDRADRLREVKRPRNALRPRPPARLAIESLETREVPLDVFSLLQGGVALGGLPLIAGNFETPLSALFAGNVPTPKSLPSGVALPAFSQIQLPTAEPPRDPGLLSVPPQPQYVASPQPPALAQREGVGSAFVDTDWLAELSAALDAPSGSRLAEPPDAASAGGGGGGDSSAFSPAAQAVQGGAPFASAGSSPGGALDPVTSSLLFGPTSADAAPPPEDGGGGGSFSTSEGHEPLTLLAGGGEAGAGTGDARLAPERAVQAAVVGDFGRSRLGFEQNAGQTAAGVSFLSRGSGFLFFLKNDELVFATARPPQEGQQQSPGRDVFRMRLLNMNPAAEVVGRDELAQRTNYFIGSDPTRWRTDVPNFGKVEVREAFAGVDLVLRSRTPTDRVFEHDFVVKPGASLASVRVRWEGLQSVSTDGQGRLLLQTGGGTVIQDAPVLYQEGEGGTRTVVQGRYVLHGNGEVGFEAVGGYDPSRALVVDPSISFATYLGGSGDDKAYGVSVDDSGSAYVAGTAASSNFPTANGFDSSFSAGDGFVSKLSSDGRTLLWSSYLGGSAGDSAVGVAVHPSGQVFVTGTTPSSDFPVTAGAYKTTYTGPTSDAYVAVVSASGSSLAWASYLGGGNPRAQGIAVDAAGAAYVVGAVTNSSSLAAFTATAGAYQTTHGGGATDAFVTKFVPGGSTLSYSTYVGGSGADNNVTTGLPTGISVDGSGNVYVAGVTTGSFPTTGGAYTTTYQGGTSDGFVAKLNSTGTALTYSTYLGGSSEDAAYGLALDADGRVFVTGKTASSNYPTVAGAYQTSLSGTQDAFVTALNSSFASLYLSTYLGGTAVETGWDVAVDGSGRPVVAGMTASTNFPTLGAFQGSSGGNTDAFISRLTTTGTLSYSSYHGGSGMEEGYSVALSPAGDAYLAGYTSSTNLTTTPYAYQVSNAGNNDAFIARVLDRPAAPTLTTITDDTGASSSDQVTSDQTINLVGRAGANVTVTLERIGHGVLGDVAASSSGLFTYNYTGTTLSEGSYAFTARAKDSTLALSDYGNDFLVHIDRTAPTVTVSVPSSTTSLGPEVMVTAYDLYGVSATATLALDVDKNNDNDFLDAGEASYATGTLSGGQATVKLSALASTGTYRVQARALDLAGNEGTSSASTFAVSAAASPWVATAKVLSVDPGAGTFDTVLGDAGVAHGLDLDQSPGTEQGGSPALVYHSSSVNQQPFVQVTLPSDTAAALPANIVARLTFNGTAAATVTMSTSGFASGDVLTFALQAPSAITTTGRYGYSVLVQVSGQADQTVTGSTYVVAQDSSAFGAGWAFAGVDRLHSIASDANGPAGVLRAYGTGGWRFYTDAGSGSYTSPTGDNGTLSKSGNTYTYSTPDGQSWTFDNSGYQTKWTAADGIASIAYSYDGSSRLSGITAIDGGLSTFTYTGSTTVAIQTVNSRLTTLTLSSGDLTKVANPDGGVRTFTYSSHRLTNELFGPNLENNWAYTSTGVLGTFTWGATSVAGVTNLTRTVPSPLATRGLNALLSGTVVYASSTDPVGGITKVAADERGRVTQVIAPDGGISRYEYTSGFVTKETDALGRVTSYTRDGSGYVTKQENPDGGVVTYQYQSAFHALTTVINERGNTSTMAYSSTTGNLTRSTDALGNATAYSYNASGLLETETDPLGNVTSYTYDGNRRLSTVKDALTRVNTTTYDSNGNIRTTVDALGRTTTYSNDALGRTTATTDALDNVVTNTFDGAGLGLTTVMPLGAQSSTVYDTFKRGLVSKSLQVGTGLTVGSAYSYDDAARVSRFWDAAGYSGTVGYDPEGRVSSSTDALGGATKSFFNLAGEVLSARDEMGRWTNYLYDSMGRRTRVTDALGNIVTTTFDKAGNVTATTNALGKVFTSTYDALNRVTGTLDALSRRTTTTFDAAGNVATQTDRLANVTSYAYDALNRQTKVTVAVGSSVQATTETSYDEVGNVKTTKDALGNVTSYLYDALNRRTEVIDPLTHRTTTTYDAEGGVTSVKDALGKLTSYNYDSLHRQVAVKNPLGNTSTMVLDAMGRTAATWDPLNNVQRMVFDPLGRDAGSVASRGGVTAKTYDAAGSMRTLKDPVANEWKYAVDGLGRESTRTDPAGAVNTTTYDAESRVSTVTDRLGQQTVNGYDDANRLVTVTWKNNAGATVNLLTYSYDANDNLLTAKDYNGTVTYTYDEQDRVKSYANVFGQVLTYTLDAEGQVTKREDSLGGVLTSVYDAQQRLTSRRFTGTGATGTAVRVDFGYTDRDEQSSVTWYSDIAGSTVIATSTYARDDASRLTSIVNKDSSAATLSYYNYAYDNADRVNSHSWSSAIGTTTYSGTNTYTYDSTSQLTNDSTTAYSYDLNGNRTMAGYATGAANRMSNDGTWTYTHDAAGYTTQKSKGSGLETVYFTYDHRDRLTNIRNTSDGSTNVFLLTYTYDLLDNRVQEDRWKSGEGNSTTRFAYDASNVIIDMDGSNAALARRIFGDGTDRVLVRNAASGTTAGTSVYFTDNLGSVRDVANASGAVKGHSDFTGFGVRTDAGLTWLDRYSFQGREYQSDIGLNYHHRRWYDPPRGVWMSEDPWQIGAGDANFYRPMGNQPTNLTDPWGLFGAEGAEKDERGTVAPGKPVAPKPPVRIREQPSGSWHPRDKDEGDLESLYPGREGKMQFRIDNRMIRTLEFYHKRAMQNGTKTVVLINARNEARRIDGERVRQVDEWKKFAAKDWPGADIYPGGNKQGGDKHHGEWPGVRGFYDVVRTLAPYKRGSISLLIIGAHGSGEKGGGTMPFTLEDLQKNPAACKEIASSGLPQGLWSPG